MNFIKRVAATAALLASCTAGASAALLHDATASESDTFAATSNADGQRTTNAFAATAFQYPQGNTAALLASGAMLSHATVSPGANRWVSIDLPLPATLNATALQRGTLPRPGATLAVPAGLTLTQPKPKASIPFYMHRASYRQAQ